mmetsp:Transcript_19494/g.49889  ORF Transcript_19494/g.49889 Transcript_19494/m.49889 type:complete len:128 (+) Transcript_19494:1453-1836(+)
MPRPGGAGAVKPAAKAASVSSPGPLDGDGRRVNVVAKPSAPSTPKTTKPVVEVLGLSSLLMGEYSPSGDGGVIACKRILTIAIIGDVSSLSVLSVLSLLVKLARGIVPVLCTPMVTLFTLPGSLLAR